MQLSFTSMEPKHTNINTSILILITLNFLDANFGNLLNTKQFTIKLSRETNTKQILKNMYCFVTM